MFVDLGFFRVLLRDKNIQYIGRYIADISNVDDV